MFLPAVTLAAIVAIALLTLWLAVFRYNVMSITYGPTILTMIGIFGCFLGIAIGLMHFDTANVQGSVPSLLAGDHRQLLPDRETVLVGAARLTRLREDDPVALEHADALERRQRILEHAAELYAEASRAATSVPERDPLTREAARVRQLLWP